MRIQDQHLIRDLLAYEGDDVVSLFLPVDPADPRNQQPQGREWWRSEAKALLSDLDVGNARDDRLAFRDVIDNLQAFAETYVPDERTLVVYATPDDVYTLPLQVDIDPEAAIGQPVVGPLLKAVTAYRHYLVVLIGADEVRAVEAHLGELEDRGSLRTGKAYGMRGATRSGHRFRFEAHREEAQRAYHRTIAEELDRVILEGQFDRVLLGGAEREAHGVLAAMNEKAAEVVVGIARIPVDASAEQIVTAGAPLALDFEERAEEEAVRRVLRLLHSSGTAVVGLANTRQALSMFVVRRLVIAAGALDEDVREDLIRQAYAQGASVLFVFGPARDLLDEHEGLAAELYYNPY